MYKKLLKSFSKSSSAQDLSTKGLDKPGKASKLTQSSSGGYIEGIAHGKRQPLSCRK
jgi:hypothetical protein